MVGIGGFVIASLAVPDLFVGGALSFGAAATALSSTFHRPDILREPAEVVLPAVVDGGTSPVWIWFATADSADGHRQAISSERGTP
jgi:hypothetical protein